MELAEDHYESGGIDIREVFIDRSFSLVKKGAFPSARQNVAREPESWRSADAAGFPLAVHVESASSHEVKRVEKTLDQRFVPNRPDRIIGNKACDNDGLDQALKKQGVERIAPHRRNRTKPKTQDGRKLRRYER